MSHIKFGLDIQIKSLRAQLLFAWESAGGLKLPSLSFKKKDHFTPIEERQNKPYATVTIHYQGEGAQISYDRSEGIYKDDAGPVCSFPDRLFTRRERPDGDRHMALRP
jgi:hypothetical protein